MSDQVITKAIHSKENTRPLSSKFTIDLDCPPGTARPDERLPKALEGTELTPGDFVITSTFFGNWEFRVIEEKEDLYEASQPQIGENVKALYRRGAIRYGSW